MLRGLRALVCRLVLMLASVIAMAGLSVLGSLYPAPAILTVGFLLWKKGRRRTNSGSHGTARVANAADLAGMLGDTGLILGRVGFSERPTRLEAVRGLWNPFTPPELACGTFMAAYFKSRWMSRRFIRVTDYVHLSTFSPSGGGKSVSVLLPNLLSFPGSCVVIDPKGELYTATAAARARQFGHRIIRVDAAGVCGPGGDCYNPLDFVPRDAVDLVELCRDRANQVVIRSGLEHDRHWDDGAENMIASMIYMICKCEQNPADRNLQALREILSSREKYERAVWFMKTYADNGMLGRLGQQVSWHIDRELHSVMSTVQRHTQFMDSPLLAQCMTKSTFHPEILRGKATVYLIVPHDKLIVWQAWLRLLVGSMLRTVTRRGADESNPILFMIDEAGHLGQMRALEDAVTLYRGMGIRLWFFWQSMDQLKACFGERANVVLGNMDTQQYFNIRDYETAEAISRRIGDETITTTSVNRTTSRSRPTYRAGAHPQAGSVSDSTSVTTSDLGRRLLKPEEILQLRDVGLVFHKALPVIPTGLVRHHADPEFKQGRAGRQGGLGFLTEVRAALTLAVSVVFAAMVSCLPATDPLAGRQSMVSHDAGMASHADATNPLPYAGQKPYVRNFDARAAATPGWQYQAPAASSRRGYVPERSGTRPLSHGGFTPYGSGLSPYPASMPGVGAWPYQGPPVIEQYYVPPPWGGYPTYVNQTGGTPFGGPVIFMRPVRPPWP